MRETTKCDGCGAPAEFENSDRVFSCGKCVGDIDAQRGVHDWLRLAPKIRAGDPREAPPAQPRTGPTPEPWYIGNSMVGAERPYGICRSIPASEAGLSEEDGPGEETIAEVCPTTPPETALADARLIAAAPDLLAFVERIEADENTSPGWRCAMCAGREGTHDAPCWVGKIRADARALLARIGGGK